MCGRAVWNPVNQRLEWRDDEYGGPGAAVSWLLQLACWIALVVMALAVAAGLLWGVGAVDVVAAVARLDGPALAEWGGALLAWTLGRGLEAVGLHLPWLILAALVLAFVRALIRG